MTETLIIFSRYPEAGKTKTRMIPALGAEGAAQLQRQMSEHTLKTARELRDNRNIAIEVHFAGGNEQLMRQWLGDDVRFIPQVAGDLGYKMRSAFARAFESGSKRVVTIGIDCPDIDSEILTAGFDSLQQKDLVIGSAADGGYYLIGLTRSIPKLFQNIDWGTEKVLKQTQAVIYQLSLKANYLKTLADVDRPEDLAIWQKYSAEKYSAEILAKVVPDSDSDRDLLLQQDILESRPYSLAEAIGREGGTFLKGESTVPKLVQAITAVNNFIDRNLRDPDAALQAILHQLVKEDPRVSEYKATPLVALNKILESIIDNPQLLYELVHQVDIKWGQMYDERPYFQQPGQPPHPEDPYTHESVKTDLKNLQTCLSQHLQQLYPEDN